MPPKKSKSRKVSASGVTAEALTRWKNVRGRRGGLKSIINMPMDVIQERSSAYLWKDALKKVDGLPSCPEGWIEPAWVSLVFSPYCTACGEGKAAAVAWEFLARFCTSCRDKMVVAENKLRLTHEQCRHFGMISKEAFIKAPVTGFKRHCYMWSQILEVLEAYGTLDKSGKAKEASDCANKYVQQARRSQEHAALCRKWADNEERLRTGEVESIIRGRFKELRALGWGPELDFIKTQDYTPLSQHKLVLVAKKLTDRVWQNIQSEFIHCMEGIREERLEHEFKPVLAKRWPILVSAGNELLDRYLGEHPDLLAYGFNVGDLAISQEFRNIMNEPADEDVDITSFFALEGHVGTIVERWRTRVCEELRGLFVKHEIKLPEGRDPLELATTLFSGTSTSTSFWQHAFFPDVVADRYLRFSDNFKAKDGYERFVYDQPSARLRCYISCDMLRPIQPGAKFMQEIIELCGRDPVTVTAEEMDVLDVRLVDECRHICVTWRGAILLSSARGGWYKWRLASIDETAKVKKLEMVKLEKEKLWTCTRCETSRMPVDRHAIWEHLRNDHEIERPETANEAIKMNRILASTVLGRIMIPVGRSVRMQTDIREEPDHGDGHIISESRLSVNAGTAYRKGTMVQPSLINPDGDEEPDYSLSRKLVRHEHPAERAAVAIVDCPTPSPSTAAQCSVTSALAHWSPGGTNPLSFFHAARNTLTLARVGTSIASSCHAHASQAGGNMLTLDAVCFTGSCQHELIASECHTRVRLDAAGLYWLASARAHSQRVSHRVRLDAPASVTHGSGWTQHAYTGSCRHEHNTLVSFTAHESGACSSSMLTLALARVGTSVTNSCHPLHTSQAGHTGLDEHDAALLLLGSAERCLLRGAHPAGLCEPVDQQYGSLASSVLDTDSQSMYDEARRLLDWG
ncbi:uncharacterized protein B0H18DRAFT_1103992 [Fomitopsis serialis]|uniref:uncharacterized protein n=1 Tax=Fomitopsis serialis TaxID=139415 RepID=UPI00200848BC|nr:uncharacterized protein B0H18DRAFT_1103992 [Neoantrodia serialis]KAH9927816.1 hypothetical protein B0H18DRAFT_1103992 [Neoantrodia serialis]